MPVDVSVGEIQDDEVRDQVAHADRFGRRYPVFISLTEGALHDVHFIDEMFFEAGSICVFDRGYLDFS